MKIRLRMTRQNTSTVKCELVWLVVWTGRLIVFWKNLLNSGLTFCYLQVGRKGERKNE